MLPELKLVVVGMKAGESKDVTVNFPEDYHGKDVAGNLPYSPSPEQRF